MKKIYLAIAIILLFSKLQAQEYSFVYDGDERSYIMYVPSTNDGSKPFPVIITLHGLGVTGYLQSRWWPNIRADIMGYIAVFPTGVDRGWNSYGSGYPDDVGYISALIDTIGSNYLIDTSRIYITGHSNGAHMCYTLAALTPDKFTAIAPVEGYLFSEVMNDIHTPVPLMHIHALDDSTVRYNGYESEDYNFIGIDSVMSIWRANNNCSPIADTIYDKDIILGLRWPSPGNSADVNLIKYETGGHMMPETPISSTDFILDFFYNTPPQKLKLRLTDDLENTYSSHSNIEINTVVEPIDSVAKMEFFANLIKIGEDTLPPYSFVWNDIPYGDYYLNAKATDSSGTVVVSSNPKLVHITLPNAALNKPTACSSISGPFPNSNAFDGNFNTRWSSAFSDPQWIVVDLEDYYEINAVTLAWEGASSKSYLLMVSDDFVNWQNSYSTTNSPGFSDYIIFDTVTAKYVCMYGYERTTPWGHSLWEFQVCGDSSLEFHESTEQITVEGFFTHAINPSTNNFRLFDTVCMLQDNSESYVLTVNGFWLTDDEVTVNNVTVHVNDSIMVSGIRREKEDSSGNKIVELEIKDLVLIWSLVNDKRATNSLLKQNHPNPLSDETIIEYNLQKRSQVELNVIDATGTVIQTLVNEVHNPGSYQLKFYGSQLSAGVYFYQLKVEEGTETKKFIISR